MGTRDFMRYFTPSATLTWTMACVLLNESVSRPGSYSGSCTQNLTTLSSGRVAHSTPPPTLGLRTGLGGQDAFH